MGVLLSHLWLGSGDGGMSRVSCQKGSTRHAYAWQIGPFWQETLDVSRGIQRFENFYVNAVILDLFYQQRLAELALRVDPGK